LYLSLTALLVFWVDQSWALNWEGHEGFFGDDMPLDEFVEGVPPPIIRMKPDCRLLAAQHAANVYQQVPLPGVNCTDKSPSDKKATIPPEVPQPETGND
jgi:hypothetical protein